MPKETLNELIHMYSGGVISRESLERAISSWSIEDAAEDTFRPQGRDAGDCIVLYPDQTGTWRAPH